MSKVIEMTGSPKTAGFSDKGEFLNRLAQFGYVYGKMKKRDNPVDILVTDDLDSTTNKMALAKELGIEIMSYLDLKEAWDIVGDLDEE